MTMNELNFNDIPADIKSKIFKINKDAEQEEGSTRTYEHLNGKFIIHTKKRNRHNADGTQRSWGGSDFEQDWYWINCVNCGEDTSHRKSDVAHACKKCWSNNHYRISAPLALTHEMIPIIKNGKVQTEADLMTNCLFDSDDEW